MRHNKQVFEASFITVKLVSQSSCSDFSFFIDKKSKILQINKENTLSVNYSDSEYSIIVMIYQNDAEIHQETMKIRENIIGTIKFSNLDKTIDFSLLFRIICPNKPNIRIKDLKLYDPNDFEVIKQLGHGSHGKTYLAKDKDKNEHVFKQISLYDINRLDNHSIREIVPFLILPKHPCIIMLEGYFFIGRFNLVLVLEYASRGNLDSIDFKNLDNDKKTKLFYGLFSVIGFLHEYGFIHRDLCPQNVLVSSDYEIKLVDFGVSRFLGDYMTSNVGHRDYQSFEMKNLDKYDERTDEYSIGIILKELCLEDPYLGIYSNLLLFEDLNLRLKCSEACNLIESGIFSGQITESLINYFDYLSLYFESSEVGDYIIFYLFFCELGDHVYDFIKLYCNIDPSTNNTFYCYILSDFEGIAYEFVSFKDNISLYILLCKSFQLAEWKDKLTFNHYLLKDESQILLSLKFYRFFNFDFGRKYALQLSKKNLFRFFYSMSLFFDDEVFSFLLDNLKILYEFHDAPNILYDFIIFLITKYGRNSRYQRKIFLNSKGEYSEKAKLKFLEHCLIHENYYAGNELALILLDNHEDEIALKIIENGADHGNYISLSLLAEFYYYGTCVKPDERVAYELWRKSANKGNGSAQFYLAVLNIRSKVIPQNLTQAFYYCYLSTKQSYYNKEYLCSFSLLGLFYYLGIVVEQNFQEAKKCFKKSVSIFVSAISLAEMYSFGLGCEINIKKAKMLLLQFIEVPIYKETVEFFLDFQPKEYKPETDELVFYENDGYVTKTITRKEFINILLTYKTIESYIEDLLKAIQLQNMY